MHLARKRQAGFLREILGDQRSAGAAVDEEPSCFTSVHAHRRKYVLPVYSHRNSRLVSAIREAKSGHCWDWVGEQLRREWRVDLSLLDCDNAIEPRITRRLMDADRNFYTSEFAPDLEGDSALVAQRALDRK